MNPATLLIGANDEHGLQPPTAGKRTPVMPYLGRSFYENEFNRPTKLRFLATLARLGFRVLDIKPEITDTSVSTRVRKANREGVNALVTFAYNATQNESFNPVQGTIVFYSTSNANPAGSRRLSTLVSSRINNLGVIPGILLGCWRILRCHPFSKGGYDPAPENPFLKRWVL